MLAAEWFGNRWFSMVHGRNLVYNTCWEDPRLDRVALDLGPEDEVLVITSAGCNALDYVLGGAKRVHAVDMNRRQNALLDLKIAAIKQLSPEQFFSMFGKGRLPDYQTVYWNQLRPILSSDARGYWDKYIIFFSGAGARKSFYFRGSSGSVAHMVNLYIDKIAKVRPGVEQILNATSIEEQKAVYDKWLGKAFWNKFIRWIVGRDTTMSLLGVPRAQRQHLEKNYQGGIVQFVEDCIEAVFTKLPLHDNYFWRVYLTGEYTPTCCPEYVRPENFERLKQLVDRVQTCTCSVLDFVKQYPGRISRFVLLDHMDWLSTSRYPILEQEWQWIVNKAAPDARILWRSGGLETGFVDQVRVEVDGQQKLVGQILEYNRPLAEELHRKDRVHTYGSFHIADLKR